MKTINVNLAKTGNPEDLAGCSQIGCGVLLIHKIRQMNTALVDLANKQTNQIVRLLGRNSNKSQVLEAPILVSFSAWKP